ncbi:uncharacterized protein LOC116171628 [Photinus pyralis]|uniref:uncharacterized protein LOC116171628 n=1 Tax=Photinus pyralis TaxID=7054 RepID=UPI0012670883|nr:uncharacterized protein LOC116171628 [Photinus pyralis]
MLKNEKPVENEWLLCDIKIEGYSNTLEGARKKAENPDYSSSQEQNDTGRGKRKKIAKNRCSSSSETVNECTPPPTPTQYISNLEGTSDNHLEPSLEHEEGEYISQEFEVVHTSETSNSPLLINDLPVDIVPENFNTHQIHLAELTASVEQVKALCITNERILRDMYHIFKNISIREGWEKNAGTSNVFGDKLPLNTIETLKEFEEYLKEQEKKELFISYMKNIGGHDPKDNINRCLSRVFTNNLGVQCSWMGHRGNFKVQNLTIMNAIIEVVMLRYNSLIQLSDLERNVGEWFRLSKQRLQRGKEKDKENVNNS